MPTVSEAEIAELHAILGDLSKKYGSLGGDLTDRIQKLESGQKSIASAGGHYAPSFRDLILGSKAFQGRPVPAQRGMVINAVLQTKDILGVSRSMPQVVPTVAGGPRQTLRVASLIPSTPTTAGAVTYTREASFTNLADVVAEGAAKPQSEKTFATATAPVEVIAHYFRTSKQCWEDLPSLAAELESNLLYGLDLKLEQQILKGTGTTPQLAGIYPQATAAASSAIGTPFLERLFLAVAEVNAAGWQANGIVMAGADYVGMILQKDTLDRYIDINSLPLPPIVVSPSLAPGEFLAGDFRQAHLFVREDSVVTVAAQNEDDFIRNKLTILGEMRLALVTYQLAAFRKDGVLAATAEARPSAKKP